MPHGNLRSAWLTGALVGVLAASAPAAAQTRALADYRSCQVQNEADFRREVQSITPPRSRRG